MGPRPADGAPRRQRANRRRCCPDRDDQWLASAMLAGRPVQPDGPVHHKRRPLDNTIGQHIGK
jgi:hypothetical protein